MSRRNHAVLWLVLGTVLVIGSPAQAKWVYTPETGWVNAKAAPKPTATEQFEEGQKLYAKEDYDRASGVFGMVRRFFPNSQHVEKADFLRADSLFKGERFIGAYNAFALFLENHPDSQNRGKAIDVMVEIGQNFISGQKRGFVGTKVKLFRARSKGVEIVEKAISYDEFHPRVPGALMGMGDFFYENERYERALEQYSRIVKNYPDSDERAQAEYQMMMCEVKQLDAVRYDSVTTKKVRKMCLRLDARYEGETGEKAAVQAEAMYARQAQKEYETGEFYRKTGRHGAAVVYYEAVADNYSGTGWAKKAEKWIEDLSKE